MDKKILKILTIILGAFSCCICLYICFFWIMVSNDSTFAAEETYFVMRMVNFIIFSAAAGICILYGTIKEKNNLLLVGIVYNTWVIFNLLGFAIDVNKSYWYYEDLIGTFLILSVLCLLLEVFGILFYKQ